MSRALDVCVNIAGCLFRRLFFVINVSNLLLYFVSDIIGRFCINVLGESAGRKYGKWTFELYLFCGYFGYFFHFHHITMMPCISFSSSILFVCSVYSLLSLVGIYTNHSSFISFISLHASFGEFQIN